MKKLSILIPVYNAEKELPQCLDSIIPQLNDEMELILVDDGSKDGSLAVLNAYKKQYPFISVYAQENQGCTAARKKALSFAEGSYSWFIDDDDRVEDNTIERLLEYLDSDPDILVFGNTVDFVEEGYSFDMPTPDKTYVKTADAVADCFKNDNFNTYWNKFYRTSILKGHPECLPAGKENSGDLIFNCVAFTHSKKVVSSPLIAYHYQKRARETMVNRFLPDSEVILKDKEDAVREMMKALGEPYHPLIDNYLLREYEVFVINLFAEGNSYNGKERVRMVRENVTTPSGIRAIQNAETPNRYSEIFKKTARSGNPVKIVRTYALLSFAKNTFSGIYRRFRRRIYTGK